MLNPTLSDLIGGIQSVTLGDEEARRRRTQKSVLERKAPPTFDVIVEIQDRERVMVHADVSETVDALLRGDPVAPEQRWKDEAGVHKSQSRPRPSPREQLGREQLGRERFSGLVGSGGGGWRAEPGWRGTGDYRTTPWDPGASARPGFRPGASGGWREPRGRAGESGGRTMPGERIARFDDRGAPGGNGGPGVGSTGGAGPAGARGSAAGIRGSAAGARGSSAGAGGSAAAAPFVAGEIADRGPVERGTVGETAAEIRARDAREWERQAQWRDQASRALEAFKAEEGTGPANAADLVADDERLADRAVATAVDEEGPALRVETGILPTLRVYPHGISRKRLEQAIKELQLPVIVARLVDEADVVMTLRSEYRQKGPTIREAEERALPVYVLKANTIVQMQASLTSIYSLEVDPREAALRETEEAIGLVVRESQPVELAPQNAYIRRLQHQMAERANVVSRSRGREPYRRVRLYPDEARTWR
jgi:R3H domain